MNAKRSIRSRLRDFALLIVAIAALSALAAVVIVAPKVAPPPKPTNLTVDATTVGGTSPKGSQANATPTPAPATKRAASPSSTPAASARPQSAVEAQRSKPRSIEADIAREQGRRRSAGSTVLNCSDVVPGAIATKCRDTRRPRTVFIGGLGAPVSVRDTLVAVHAVSVLPSQRKGYRQVRLRGGFVMGGLRGELPRSQYYFGFRGRRFSARRTGTGLTVKRAGTASDFRIAFEVPVSLVDDATKSGVRVRLAFMPPGEPMSGNGPMGLIVLNLAEAER